MTEEANMQSLAIKVTAFFRDDTRNFSCFVPAVEKYENEEQEDGFEVFTRDSLESEIESAMSLGDDGTIRLPIFSPGFTISTGWLPVKNLIYVVLDRPELIDESVFSAPAQ